MVLRRSRRSVTMAVVVVPLALSMATPACTDDDGDDVPTGPTRPLPIAADDEVQPAVPVDDSPFCRTMLALDDTGDDPTLQELTEVYVDIADDVPAEIRPDFDVVLARLVALTSDDAAAIDTIDEAAAEESLIELAAFIERRCRGTAMNPLPPPTVPGRQETNE